MKWILALVVLAVLGFAVSGCGSAKRSGSASFVTNTVDTHSPSGTIYMTGTKTFTWLKLGTPIACKGGETVNVPSGETEIAEGGHWARVDATHSTAPTTLDLKRDRNGTVVVSCSRK